MDRSRQASEPRFARVASELTALALLVSALAIAGFVANRVRMTPALGYLGVGMIAAAFPQVHEAHTFIEWGNEIGILILLFAIGLELDLKRLRDALQSTAMTLPFDLLVPAFAVAGAFRLLGWSAKEAVALGLAVGLSSTLFGERMTSSPHTTPETRRRVLGVLLAEDVAAGALLAVIAVLGGDQSGWTDPFQSMGLLILSFVILAALALLIIPRLLDSVARSHQHELVVLAGLGTIIAFGALGYYAGSAELGALVAGVAAAEAGSRFVVRNDLRTFRGLAIALVFFATGTGVQMSALAAGWHLSLLLAAVFWVGKMTVHVPSALAQGQSIKPALHTGLSLGTIGEFSLIMVAAAQHAGIAHPLLSSTVVGALVMLLVVTSILNLKLDAIARFFARTPARIRKPIAWLVYGARRSTPNTTTDPGLRRQAFRLFASNLVLLIAWGLLVGTMGPRALASLPFEESFTVRTIMVGLGLAVAAPLAVGAYRAYRDLVWILVGLRQGERAGAGQARVRIVDAWIAVTVALVMVPVVLAVPEALPVLLGALLFAVIVAAIAWRQLGAFHRALELSVTRVLGQDEASRDLLERTITRYPWGVRFSAVGVNKDSPVANRTVEDSGIARLTGAMVPVIQRKTQEIVNPPGQTKILPGDTLVLMGDVHQLSRAEALVVAHGDALRLSVQSQHAQLEDVLVAEMSGLVGERLGDLDLRHKTGALVVGVWPKGSQHPRPYADHYTIGEGDTLIVVGTKLQLQRTKLLASGAVPPDEADKT